MILGLIFLLYLISRIISIHFVKTIPTTTTKVVYRNPVGTNIHVVPPPPPPHPYYNPYKAQYYNSSI